MRAPSVDPGRALLVTLIVLSALAFWTMPLFITVDGTTHSYTARLLLERWSGQDDPFTELNSYWLPNALGHYLLAAMQLVLSPDLAQRLLIFLLILGPGLGLLKWCTAMGRPVPWPVLFVLPFCYNFLLMMGFFNFLLGMTLALFLMAFAQRHAPLKGRNAALFVLASLAVFWSHAMTFFFVGLNHGVLALMRFLDDRGRASTKARWIALLRSGALLVPGTLLFVLFTGDHESHWGPASVVSNLYDLKNVRSLVLINFIDENAFNAVIGALFVGFLLKGAWDRLAGKAPFGAPGDALLLGALVLLPLYLFVPDSTGYASFITQRLQLMMAFLLIAWTAVVTTTDRWTLSLLVVLLAAHGLRLNYIRDRMAPFQEQRLALAEAARSLPEGATVLPINFEPEWLLGHQAAELGVHQRLHVLDNYECSMGYFPLTWRKDLPPPVYEHLVTPADRQCFAWLKDHVADQGAPSMDHIALIGTVDSSSCKASNVLPILNAHYRRTFDNGYVRVYSLNK